MDGYFSPDGPAWTLHRDSSAMVGGIRSLIVQALNPTVMTAVDSAGDFSVDFWGRLTRTSEFLLTIVYGARNDADRYASAVRRIHSRIVGFDSHAQRHYRADDADLLLWVQNATVESHLTAYRRFGPGGAFDADTYVREMGVLGELMGIDRQFLPENERELRDYFDEVGADLYATPEAKRAVRRMLEADLPLALRPLWLTPTFGAFASLPPAWAAEYGLRNAGVLRPGTELAARTMVAGLRVLLPEPPIIAAARDRARAAA